MIVWDSGGGSFREDLHDRCTTVMPALASCCHWWCLAWRLKSHSARCQTSARPPLAAAEITTDRRDGLEHVMGDFAVASVTKICAEDVQGKDYATAASTNPVSKLEAAKLIELIRAKVRVLTPRQDT